MSADLHTKAADLRDRLKAAITELAVAPSDATEAEVIGLTAAIELLNERLAEAEAAAGDPAEETPAGDPAGENPTSPDSGIDSEKEKQMSGPAIIKSNKDQKYSLNKFILALSEPTAAKDAGFEFEMSQECAVKSGKSSSTPMVPFGIICKAQDSVTPPTDGQDLGISLAKPQSIDSLFTVASSASYQASAAGQLGVPVFQAPLGEFSVPRMVSPILPAWVARDADVPTVDGKFDALKAVPHTLGAVTQINRSALIDCSPSMQTVISDALWRAVLNAIDQALLGSPVLGRDDDAPSGLFDLLVPIVGPGDPNLTDPAGVLDALATVADAGMGDPQGMIATRRFQNWCRTTAMGDTLTATPFLPAPDGVLMAGLNQVWNGRMASFDLSGWPNAPTGGAINSHAIFGAFSTSVLTVLFGGGVEIQVNPYASSVYSKGAVLVRSMVDADILVRDIGKFSMGYIAIP